MTKTIALLAFFMMMAIGVKAQITSVHGTVSDEYGGLMGASVCEIDHNNRIIEAAITDMNGNFSMKIHNQGDKLRVSYVGYDTQKLAINKTEYNITLSSKTQLQEVQVVRKRRTDTGGLGIKDREVSFSTQTIDAKEFEGLGVTSIDEALQGRISGLDIIGNSGNLGAGTTMRLRGTSSLSSLTSSNPLIVVNGNIRNVDMSNFDISNANDEQFAQLLNVQPDDIDKISVLKDGAACAIYGSQAANGVILITTKRGTKGKPVLSYTLTMTGTYQPKGYKMLNGDEYTMLLKESYFNPKQDDNASDVNELNYDKDFSEYEQYNNNTDWVDAVTQFGLRQQHTLNISGGGEKAEFRISGGYQHETGSVIKQALDRFTTRVALDYKVSERITVSTNFALTYTKNEKNYDDLLSIAYKKMPNMSIYEQDANGYNTKAYYTMLQSGSSVFDGDQKVYVNPVASANLAKYNDSTYDINPELVIDYNLLGLDEDSWRLKWRGSVYMNIFNEYVDKFYPANLVTTSWNSGHNLSYEGSSKSVSFTTKHQLTLSHTWESGHELSAMGGFELTSGSSTGQGTNAMGTSTNVSSPDGGGRVTGLDSSFSQFRSLAFYLQANYSWKERYTLYFALRADGTTKFGPNKRWGYFPAASFRWNIVDEPFMEKIKKDWLSELGLRASWGVNGNQPGTDYLYVSKYVSGNRYLDTSTMKPANIRLTDLKWETTTEYGLGLDLGMLQNKFYFKFDWYNRTTSDMLVANFSIPSSTGYYSLGYKNSGKMRNTGWEFNINTDHLIKAGKFWMDINATFSNNQNEILEMDPTQLETLNPDFNYDGNRVTLQRVQLNNAFGSIYGFRYKGVYQYQYETVKNMTSDERSEFLASGKTAPIALDADGSPIIDDEGNPVRMTYNYTIDGTGKNYEFKGGDAMYEDVNHDGNINQLDIVYLGSSLPKLTGGFGFNFHYGNWGLNCQFNYRVGNKILNLARLDAEAMINNDNQSMATAHRWRKEGDVTSIPRAMYSSGTNYNTLVSDRFVEDGTFLRLNYVQLSYRFPKAIINKTGVLSGLQFYISGQNIFCLTKYKGVDPEVSYGSYGAATDTGQTPRAKSFTLGLTAQF